MMACANIALSCHPRESGDPAREHPRAQLTRRVTDNAEESFAAQTRGGWVPAFAGMTMGGWVEQYA